MRAGAVPGSRSRAIACSTLPPTPRLFPVTRGMVPCPSAARRAARARLRRPSWRALARAIGAFPPPQTSRRPSRSRSLRAGGGRLRALAGSDPSRSQFMRPSPVRSMWAASTRVEGRADVQDPAPIHDERRRAGGAPRPGRCRRRALHTAVMAVFRRCFGFGRLPGRKPELEAPRRATMPRSKAEDRAALRPTAAARGVLPCGDAERLRRRASA